MELGLQETITKSILNSRANYPYEKYKGVLLLKDVFNLRKVCQ